MSHSNDTEIIYCQQCRARNDADEKYCHKCRARLMVVNWTEEAEDATLFDSSFLDEHLLERISSLEENVRILSERLAILQQLMASEHQHPEEAEHLDGQGATADRTAGK